MGVGLTAQVFRAQEAPEGAQAGTVERQEAGQQGGKRDG